MPATRRHPHDHEDGPTLLFERQPPAARCPICPYRHVLESMSQETSALPRPGILPLPTRRPPEAATSPLPLPPLHAIPHHLAPQHLALTPSLAPQHPALTPSLAPQHPALTPSPPRSSLPRPALLTAPHGSDTLLLPDALKPGGPEAATVARPLDAPPQLPPPAPPAFDELASPDITVLQIPVAPVAPVTRPRRRRSAPDPRAFFVLNLCLGLLIVLGLLALAARTLWPAAAPAAPEAHAAP